MRLFLLFLLPIVTQCIVINQNAIWKQKQQLKPAEYLLNGIQKLKKAKQHVEQFCTPSNDLSFSMVCHEVFEDQLFPVPMEEEVLVLRLILDTFYEHKDEVIAYFTKNKKLVIPKKPMNVTVMREFQKKYNM